MDKNVEMIVTIVQALVVPLFLYAIRVGAVYLKERAKGESLQNLILLAQEASECAVAETAQTFVDSLKQSGEFNADSAKQAQKLAVGRAREIMGAKSYELLNQAVGDAGAYLTALNEAYVRADKINSRKVVQEACAKEE